MKKISIYITFENVNSENQLDNAVEKADRFFGRMIKKLNLNEIERYFLAAAQPKDNHGMVCVISVDDDYDEKILDDYLYSNILKNMDYNIQ